MKADYPEILKIEGENWQDPDPATGKLGTLVPAEWLQGIEDGNRSITLEVLSVLAEAGIKPNELNNTQLRDAIIKIVTARLKYTNIEGAPQIIDSLGDSKKDAASQRIVNVVNKLAKDAMTAANNANDKANQGIAAAKVADGKAVKAQNTADEAMKEVEKKLNLYDFGVGSSTNAPTITTGNTAYTRYPNGFYRVGGAAEGFPSWKISGDSMISVGWGHDHHSNIIIGQTGDLAMLSFSRGETKGWVEFYSNKSTTTSKDGFLRAFGNKEVVTTDMIDGLFDVPVDQIFYFDGPTPPTGYIARTGGAINKAVAPKLYARYGAKMPDDRDRVHRNAGTLAGAAGSTQEDAIRNIVGELGHIVDFNGAGKFSGAFSRISGGGISAGGTGQASFLSGFDASRVVPTASENRVKSRIIISCNKIQ